MRGGTRLEVHLLLRRPRACSREHQEGLRCGEEEDREGRELGRRYVTQYKAFFIVDTDDEIKVAKWVEDYAHYLDVEVSPIIERSVYEKAKKKV